MAVQEGVFLYTRNVSPYDGGVYHQVRHHYLLFEEGRRTDSNISQAPLLLPLFALLPKPSTSPFATNFLFILIDLLSAHALMQIAESDEPRSTRLFTSPRKDVKWDSVVIGAAWVPPMDRGFDG